MQNEKTALIRALNDALRQRHVGGRIVVTKGVLAQGRPYLAAALAQIAGPLEFDPDNDPYGEHDFGSLTVMGVQLFWKIDYFDSSLTSAAVDPADATQCHRLMTVMLAEEY